MALIIDLSQEVEDSTVLLYRISDPGVVWVGDHHFKDEKPSLEFNSNNSDTHKVVLGTVGALRGRMAKIDSFLNPGGTVGVLSMQWEIIDCSGTHLAKITENTIGRSSHVVVIKPASDAFHFQTDVWYE